jgi:hypothetical protein
MQRFDYRRCFFLAYSPAILIAHVPRLAFNSVQAANRVQCLLGQLTFICHVQIKKLASSVGCGSLGEFTDKTGTAFGIGSWPFHYD